MFQIERRIGGDVEIELELCSVDRLYRHSRKLEKGDQTSQTNFSPYPNFPTKTRTTAPKYTWEKYFLRAKPVFRLQKIALLRLRLTGLNLLGVCCPD